MELSKRLITLGSTLVSGTVLAAGSSPIGSMDGRSVPLPHISMPASEESIKRLLQITGVHELLDDNLRQVDERITAGLQRSIGGRNLTPEQQAIMVQTHDKISALVKESISWEVMEPVSIRMYRETLTQDELDGMLAFYKTPAGKAVIKKMPLLAQAVSNEMQRILQSMMPKLVAIAKESENEMKLATPVFDPTNPPSEALYPSAPPSTTPVPLKSPAPGTNPGLSPNSPDK
jgi:uncharacterized protein